MGVLLEKQFFFTGLSVFQHPLKVYCHLCHFRFDAADYCGVLCL